MIDSPMMRKIRHIHCLGIGGSGMCGIAEVLHNLGYRITGSDLTANAATERLISLGIEVQRGHAVGAITTADVVVVSSAIAAENPEWAYARQVRMPVVGRAQMLAELMRFRFGIAVAGTHGKTTTTSLIASLLRAGGLDPTFIIGGLLNSAGTNAKLGAGRYLIAEADESDASFLRLNPMMSVLTNIDSDHLSHYGGEMGRLKQAYLEFIHRLPFYGAAVVCVDDEAIRSIVSSMGRPLITYGSGSKVDVGYQDFRQEGLCSMFTVLRRHSEPLEITLNMVGEHNVLNSCAAIAVATELGVSDVDIVETLKTYRGVGRRFEVDEGIKIAGIPVTMVDDYGHHSREVMVTIRSGRDAWRDRRLVMVFQPHRYTRTQDLFEDFCEVLSQVDVLLMLDVYSAGEEPIAGADARHLCGAIRKRGRVDPIFVGDKATLSQVLADVLRPNDVLFMQGAGDIGFLAAQFRGRGQSHER